MISSSPDRHHFQMERYLERQAKEGLTPENNEDVRAMVEYYEKAIEHDKEMILDPAWAKNNLEHDLRATDWILEKVRSSEVYAQNLYAAMCNNEFQKLDVMEVLKENVCSYSWRYAGGIVAHMRQQGDYIDWYCSGIRDSYEGGYVAESVVTDEIREDLKRLGWIVLDNNLDE